MPTDFYGLPGVANGPSITPRNIFNNMAANQVKHVPAWFVIDGTLSSDPGSVPVSLLRAGLLLGRVTASKKYAPSIIGQIGKAFTGSTQINCLTTAQATELVRRIGASGTFKLTGPPTAAGVVRSVTVTYSAVGTGSAANEVQTITPSVAATAGTYTISLTNLAGVRVTTTALAFDATLAAAQAAVTAALGGVAGCVLSTAGSAAPWSAGPIALVCTFSGTGYTAMEHPPITIDNTLLIGTSPALVTLTNVETTKGVPAAATIVNTATNVNEVQNLTFNIASTGGNIGLAYTDPTTGGRRIVGAAAWSATDATYLGNIQTQLDLATGVANGIVVTATSAVDTDLQLNFTFSGTGYAAKPHALIEVITYPTSSTQATVTRTTAGVDGRFVMGSLIQPTDGSEIPVTVLENVFGLDVMNNNLARIDQPLDQFLIGGDLVSGMIIGLTENNDASIQAWIKAQLRLNGASFTFDNDRLL